jgi:hypothetical protein
MTQAQSTNLTALGAVGPAPIMLTTAGHVSPARLKELPEAAVILAQQISREAQTAHQTASGAL